MRSMVVAASLVCSALVASQPPVTRLPSPDATFAASFRARSVNRILEPAHSIQELSNGRALIKVDGRLLLGDPKTGRVSPVPDSVGGMLSLGGDTTIMYERSSWRFLVGGTAVGQLPASNPIVAYLRENFVEPTGSDARGFVYTELPGRRPNDSMSIVRIDRQTGDHEVIAALGMPRLLRGGVCVNLERAAYFPDGWIAVLRAEPYRVDWRNPSGTWVRGAPISLPTVAVTDAEKQIYHAWEGRDRERIFPEIPLRDLEWPKTICAWHSGYVPLAMPDGRVLVYRVPNSTLPATRYDVINRRGEVERQLALDPNQAIVGIGKRSVYVRSIDGTAATITRHPITW